MTPFPQWTTRIDRIRCHCGHDVRPKAPGAIITVKGDCLRPFTCGNCKGRAIGVQSEHHGIIVFYGCNPVVFDQIVNWPEDAKTWILLVAMEFILDEEAA